MRNPPMPPVAAWRGRLETVGELELAAHQRLEDARRVLIPGGRPGAAVYLCGYAVEMLLKVSCFELHGARSTDPVAPCRSAARSHVTVLPPGALARPYGDHDLLFWLDYLRHLRNARPVRAWSGDFARTVDRRITFIHSVWSVEMRYHQLEQMGALALRSVWSVRWLLRVRDALRS